MRQIKEGETISQTLIHDTPSSIEGSRDLRIFQINQVHKKELQALQDICGNFDTESVLSYLLVKGKVQDRHAEEIMVSYQSGKHFSTKIICRHILVKRRAI